MEALTNLRLSKPLLKFACKKSFMYINSTSFLSLKEKRNNNDRRKT